MEARRPKGGSRVSRTKTNPDEAAIARAVAQYRKDHWGQIGDRAPRSYVAADPRQLSIELGELVAVIYRTKKGTDVVLTDYEHRFSRPRPVLTYNRTGLIIAGGHYHVTERGIIG
jgi:hypothetical protein